MKKTLIIASLLTFFGLGIKAQSYNNLWIPDTLSGTNFNLTIKDTFAQLTPGNQTITAGINGKFWGPTLFFNKGDTVHLNVRNKLNEATTIHWHGFHLPAVMDGGPHQVIPQGALWQPYWKVTNNASTYWYHPHLHEKTEEHITKGIGGLIIVRDEIESALPLPRSYGVDDIPLVLTDRDFNNQKQFVVVPYGDSMMVNGTLRAQYTVPGQVVRFRILNAAIERSYNIGFSDNRNFSIICSDGGLLNAPVSVNRYLLNAGERIEILVNFSGQIGQNFDLKAFNSTLSGFIPGGENFVNGPFGNYLGHKDFTMLHIKVGAQTANPITSIPLSLTNNVLLNTADANITRILSLSDSAGVTNPPILGPNAFIINHKLFDINHTEYQVPLGNTEIWEIRSSSIFGHPFHIHDVEFNILSINGAPPPAAQAGWKDVVFIPRQQTVRFIARFEDYADSQHPFMYHCHISLHEDEGMMGQFVVTQPLTGSSASTNIACKGDATGAINLTVAGGNPPYTYNWGSGITTQNRSGLVAGTYTVTVTDATAKTIVQTVTITQPQSILAASATLVPVDCFGDQKGQIDLQVTGGTSGYSFIWNDGNTDQNRTGIAAGTYVVTVSDANHCTAVITQGITQPAAPLVVTASSTLIACFGDETGSIQLNASGGTSGYLFLWNDGNTAHIRNALSAGTYTITISDANQCTATKSITLSEPTAPLTASVQLTPITCFGTESGAIELNPSGGTPGYTFLWNDGNTAQNRLNLSSGAYSVVITDGNGCVTSVLSNISQPSEIVVTSATTPATCGENNGAITVSVEGGLAPYSFLWSNGLSNQNLGAVPSGTYMLTLTDANACTIVNTSAINNLNGPIASAEVTPVNCFGQATGSIQLSISNGTPPFSFLWNDGTVEQNRMNLNAGDYSITIMDLNHCASILTPTIDQPAAFSATLSSTAEFCEKSNGSIALNATGGTLPYTYQWSNGMTTANISGIISGDYSVLLTDALGCSSAYFNNVDAVNRPIAAADAIHVNCFGDATGAIQLSVENGTPPFVFIWNNGFDGPNQHDLMAGIYSVTITDANACTTSLEQTIGQPDSLLAVSVNVTNATGMNGGSVSAMSQGGNPPYLFAWSNGATDNSLDNLMAGNYSVTVTDANQCTAMGNGLVELTIATKDLIESADLKASIHPNPASEKLFVRFSDPAAQAYYISITNSLGKTLLMLPQPPLANGIDISQFKPGVYFLQLTEERTKAVFTLSFTKVKN